MSAIKLGLLCIWLLFCYVALWATQKAGKLALRDRIACVCNRGILRIVGIKLKVRGAPSSLRPLIMVSNHVSYLDIHLIGSQFPVRYTPKSDIADWPIIGGICRFSDSIFIDRRPEKTIENKDKLKAQLTRGDVVCLFPEGTTGNGLHMEPFKSGFFQLAEEGINGNELFIQPVVLSYTHIRSLPMDRTQWPLIAWYGDMELLPHLRKLLTLGSITAEISFLEPLSIKGYQNRKALAAASQLKILEAIELYKK